MGFNDGNIPTTSDSNYELRKGSIDTIISKICTWRNFIYTVAICSIVGYTSPVFGEVAEPRLTIQSQDVGENITTIEVNQLQYYTLTPNRLHSLQERDTSTYIASKVEWNNIPTAFISHNAGSTFKLIISLNQLNKVEVEKLIAQAIQKGASEEIYINTSVSPDEDKEAIQIEVILRFIKYSVVGKTLITPSIMVINDTVIPTPKQD